MQEFYVCPECRTTHTEPAHATYLLVALCLDCEIAIGFHEEREAFVIAEAA